jgi:fumarate hydratase class II
MRIERDSMGELQVPADALSVRGAAIAKQAYAQRRASREVAAQMTDSPARELGRLLDPTDLTRGIKGSTGGGG